MERPYIVGVVAVAVVAAAAATLSIMSATGSGPGWPGSDPGTAMGAHLRDAPGPRVSAADAAVLGARIPDGGVADPVRRTLTFIGPEVHLVALASPAMPAESFRIAGMDDPTVTVPAGARVTIEVINADDDMAHGLVVTRSGTGALPMPMMSRPAFAGAATGALGDSTAAGMQSRTIAFIATTSGEYHYVCPIPGHVRLGMIGTLMVAPEVRPAA